MNPSIKSYNQNLEPADQEICDVLAMHIDAELSEAESKIWHAHPVWFLDGNPIVGYSKQKKGLRLMFWSGADFEEEDLNIIGENLKMLPFFISHPQKSMWKN